MNIVHFGKTSVKTLILSLALMIPAMFGAASAATLERSSARLAQGYGFSPVLVITAGHGQRYVVGIEGVSYLNAPDAVLPANVLMYRASALGWVEANFGRMSNVISANAGGDQWYDTNGNGLVDPGEGRDAPEQGGW